MKRTAALLLTLLPSCAAPSQEAAVHVSTTFHLVVPAPLPRAFALFGAQGERCWTQGKWDPHFLYPQAATDVQGAVFTVSHGGHKSVWVNTIFDAGAGRIQYVAVVPETYAFTIDLILMPKGSRSTGVAVTYTRTALDPAANAHVAAMAAQDAKSGTEWQHDLEACLKTQP